MAKPAETASRRARCAPSASSRRPRPRKPERVDRGLAALRALGFAPKLAPTRSSASRSTLPELPQQRLADLHAAFADPDTSAIMCSARRLRIELPARRPRPRNHRRASQAVLCLQRSHRHPTPPARRIGPARLSRPHARRGFLSSQTAFISKVFAPRSPASPTASAPPKACALSSPAQRISRAAARSTAAASAFSSRCSARPGSRAPKASCSFLKTPASSPTRSIACSGNCARPESSKASAASSLAKCSIASRPARRRLARPSDPQRARRLRRAHRHRPAQRPRLARKCHAHLRRRSRA